MVSQPNPPFFRTRTGVVVAGLMLGAWGWCCSLLGAGVSFSLSGGDPNRFPVARGSLVAGIYTLGGVFAWIGYQALRGRRLKSPLLVWMPVAPMCSWAGGLPDEEPLLASLAAPLLFSTSFVVFFCLLGLGQRWIRRLRTPTGGSDTQAECPLPTDASRTQGV